MQTKLPGVSWCRITDTAQTGCIVTLSYQYLIDNFARPEIADHIFKHVLRTFCLFDDADISPNCRTVVVSLPVATMRCGSSQSTTRAGFYPTYSESAIYRCDSR
jgi:hypothetical protein